MACRLQMTELNFDKREVYTYAALDQCRVYSQWINQDILYSTYCRVYCILSWYCIVHTPLVIAITPYTLVLHSYHTRHHVMLFSFLYTSANTALLMIYCSIYSSMTFHTSNLQTHCYGSYAYHNAVISDFLPKHLQHTWNSMTGLEVWRWIFIWMSSLKNF